MHQMEEGLSFSFINLNQRQGKSMEIAANKREIAYYKCTYWEKFIRILLKTDVLAWNIKSVLKRSRRKSM